MVKTMQSTQMRNCSTKIWYQQSEVHHWLFTINIIALLEISGIPIILGGNGDHLRMRCREAAQKYVTSWANSWQVT